MLDFIGAEDDGDDGDSVRYRMCSSYGQIATTNKPTPSFLKAGCPFLSSNQQCQSTVCFAERRDSI